MYLNLGIIMPRLLIVVKNLYLVIIFCFNFQFRPDRISEKMASDNNYKILVESV